MSECPTCGRDDFDTDRAMKVHHSRAHGETLRGTATCEECGDEFPIEDPTKPNNYCSRECVHRSKRDRVELTCEHCGDEFEVPKSAGDRRFCSKDCQLDSRHETHSCEMCNRTFRTPKSKPRDFCCLSCAAEDHNDRPRPDDIDHLLWLLYVYEGHNYQETWRRQRAVLGIGQSISGDQVKKRLKNMGVYNTRYVGILSKMDPDDLGEPRPDGDDSWKEIYSTGD